MLLKIGFSTCPNDTFIFDALVNNRVDAHDFEFQTHLADVEELNKLSLQESLDITKISIAHYPNIADKYVILNSGSAIGNNNGPILISKRKIFPNEISNIKIAIPGKNTTANLLLSIAYPKAINKHEYLFSKIEEAVLSGETDAGLIIHESRFTYLEKGLKKIIDMGEYWESNYNQLVPLGCIAIKRSLPENTIRRINLLIKESVNYAFKHPAESMPYIRSHAKELNDEIIQKHIQLYVNQYSIELGSDGKNAIRFLFNKGYEAGLLPFTTKEIFLDN